MQGKWSAFGCECAGRKACKHQNVHSSGGFKDLIRRLLWDLLPEEIGISFTGPPDGGLKTTKQNRWSNDRRSCGGKTNPMDNDNRAV